MKPIRFIPRAGLNVTLGNLKNHFRRGKMDDEEKVIKTEFIDIMRYGRKYKKCGNCEEEFMEEYTFKWYFCPRCGAKFTNVTQ